MKFSTLIAAAGLAALSFSTTQAADIAGAGATFPYPIYAKWADAYKKETGNGLNYQSIGSGAGIKQIQARTVTFGATDAPLKGDQLARFGLVQWPQVMGAIVVVVNLDGIKPGELVLDGPTVANIFLGTVKKWNDPAIARLNASTKLPDTDITVVRRSDGSGTTFNFTDYLAKVSDEWKTKVGVNTAVEWPVGVGGKGNEGVAGNVKQTRNAIGYVEYAYAKQNQLTHIDMLNAAGKRVAPTLKSFQAAAANADWAAAPGYYQILTNQKGDESWPITAATFILMHANPADKAMATEALKFFDWAYAKGAEMATELDYIPMPASVADMVRKTWASDIKTK